VPAPAVIPALLAYIEVDAVKKLVVGVVWIGDEMLVKSKDLAGTLSNSLDRESAGVRPGLLPFHIYFEEIRVFIAVVLTE